MIVTMILVMIMVVSMTMVVIAIMMTIMAMVTKKMMIFRFQSKQSRGSRSLMSATGSLWNWLC